VFHRPAGLALAGFALGVAGFVFVSRILQSLLLNATGFDARMPLIAGVTLVVAIFLACYFPARRATRINPVRLLHDI
jgi:ABC-type antimicrobial peptide transport system permease subunit